MKKNAWIGFICVCSLYLLTGCMSAPIEEKIPVTEEKIAQNPQPTLPSARLFRGNAQRTGFFPGPGVQSKPKVIWSAGTSSDFYTSSPIVHEGVAYIGEKQGFFYALALDSRTPKWTFQVQEQKFQMVNGVKETHHIIRSPVVAGKYIYFTDTDSFLYALDTQKGHVKWKAKFGHGASDASPLVVQDTLYTTHEKGLYALDALTGKVKWRLEVSKELIADPAYAKDIVYTGDYAGGFYAVDAKSGRLLWKRRLPGGISGTPAVANGKIYVGIREQESDVTTETSHIYALDSKDGHIVWSLRTGAQPNEGNVRGVGASIAVAYQKVFFCSYDGHVYALDANTGSIQWRYRMNSYLSHSPVVAGNLVYFAGPDNDKEGGIYALHAETGTLKWKLQSVRPQAHFNNSFWLEKNTLYYTGKSKALHAIR